MCLMITDLNNVCTYERNKPMFTFMISNIGGFAIRMKQCLNSNNNNNVFLGNIYIIDLKYDIFS